ncbi:hypothetical protein [Nocardia arthritidis]|uniref:hypothetical protein n=1 Tax=Nocardia arthritidis TaxID=228602 RepID=UPI0007A45143|nr:hypothetical protein [Nocardia arthritidis]
MDPDEHDIAVVYATEQGSTRIAESISTELAGRDVIVQLADIGRRPTCPTSTPSGCAQSPTVPARVPVPEAPIPSPKASATPDGYR